jgi:hypothetical protein
MRGTPEVRRAGPEHTSWKAKPDALLELALGRDSETLRGFRKLRCHVGVWTGVPGEAEQDVRYFAGRVEHAAAHADADGREQARDRLLSWYLSTAEAADVHLRALPGTTVPEEFTGRHAALAWLDAERASLVAAVVMAAATARDQAAMRLPFCWRSTLTGGGGSTTGWPPPSA